MSDVATMDDTFDDLMSLEDSQTRKDVCSSSFTSVQSNKTLCEKSKSPISTIPANQIDEADFTFKRTKEKIDEFELQLECFVKTKQLLLDQFAEETNALILKFKRYITGMRQKHSVCENNFKTELEISASKYQDLEQKYIIEQNVYRQNINSYEEEISKLRQQSQSEKENLENQLNDKEKCLNELKNEKFKLESQIKLQESEFLNRQHKMRDEITQLKSDQEKDRQEIKFLKENLSVSHKESLQFQREISDLNVKLGQSESKYSNLKEESNKLRTQFEIESKAKLEKVERIQSLTVTLNESKKEIESLQKNFSELENKRSNEVKELELQLVYKQNNFEQTLQKVKDDELQKENRFKNNITSLELEVRNYKNEIDSLKEELETVSAQNADCKREYELLLQKLKLEIDSLEQSSGAAISDLNEEIKSLEQRMNDANSKYESSQNELTKTKNLLASANNELKIQKTDRMSIIEKYNLLELEKSSVLADLDNAKRLLQGEAAEKKEKLIMIQNLNDSLSSSQFEIQKLKEANEQLERSLKEGDELRQSILNDCNDLRATLAEVEKSRLEIKSKLNSSQFNCVSFENKLKMKDTEITDINIKLNSLVEEKKLLQDSLDSACKSLTQMKSLNERLHSQNMSLQNKLSQLESVRLEADRKLNSASNFHTDKDYELKKMKREIDQLKDRNSKLESDKRRMERSFVNMEKECESLKSAIKCAPARRTPSPGSFPLQSDQSSRSILSLTQLLSDTNFLNTNLGSSKRDVISDETMNVIKGLEALEQKNMELQQKVLGLQNLMDAASSESDLNTTKNSDNFVEFKPNGKLIHLETISSDENGHEMFEDKNHNPIYNVDVKLKMAQMKAQDLIESYDKIISNNSTKSNSSTGKQSLDKVDLNDANKSSSPTYMFNSRIGSSTGRRTGAVKKTTN